MSAELLYTTRGDLVETIQRGHVAVVDVRGRLIASGGDPEATSYMRSAAKPLQATMVVQSGAAGRFGLAGPLLAICCASHQGEPGHVAAVREVLARAGVPESALQCGVHAPVYGPAAAALWRAGEEPAAVHNNCSGKHAGMLAAARALGAPLESYLSIDHPVQQGILANVAALTGVPRERIVIGVDGCSVPVHGVPIRAMAYAYARLADPASAPACAPLLAPLAEAMVAHPWYVRGTGGPDTALIERGGGRLVAKGGADGVLCIAVRDAGLGLAMKVESGRNERAHAVAIDALRQLGVLRADEVEAMGDLAHPPVRNHRGLYVGQARPVVKLISHQPSAISPQDDADG
ncbi:MAG TPA: asparaginase [Chloroflexota bacterium]|nr:asparaginase [Chloroflexota bacterium]